MLHRPAPQSFHTPSISLVCLIILAQILAPPSRGQAYNENIARISWKGLHIDSFPPNGQFVDPCVHFENMPAVISGYGTEGQRH